MQLFLGCSYSFAGKSTCCNKHLGLNVSHNRSFEGRDRMAPIFFFFFFFNPVRIMFGMNTDSCVSAGRMLTKHCKQKYKNKQINPARLFQFQICIFTDFKQKPNGNIKVSDSLKPPANVWVFAQIIFESHRQRFINSLSSAHGPCWQSLMKYLRLRRTWELEWRSVAGRL